METFKRIKNNRGYAMLETIFYICLFAVLSILVINSMITMTKAFKETAIQRELMQGGNIMERISREVRQSYGISLINTNSLKLYTKNPISTYEEGRLYDPDITDKTIEFSLSGTDLEFLRNGGFMGNLNTTNISVEDVVFTEISTSRGKAVKIFLRIKSLHDLSARSQDFYNTVVLRSEY